MALQYLKEGRYTTNEIGEMFEVSMTTLYQWRANFQFGGVEALILTFYNNERYQEKLNGLSPLEFRSQAV